jgi:hypothetical protein
MEMEPPQSFYYWSTLAVISAVVKDNVYLDRSAFKTYPNIYVMLHADSGLKKGPPVSLAKRLVRAVNNTRIINGRSSIQGILKELGTAVSSPGGLINKKSTGFIVASEFTSAIVNDPAALTILTDLYDRMYNEGEYASLLKMEQFKLHDPTITILVATNEAHFDDFVGNKDFKGGFIGRMFVIAESEVNRLNALIRPLKITPNETEWIKYLKEIGKLNGPFDPIYDKPAGNLYEEWYHKFYGDVKEQGVADETGTINRIGDSVLKVAMLLALAREPRLVIELGDIEEAIMRCETFIGSVRKTTLGKSGKSASALQKRMILEELVSRPNHSVSREILLKKYWMHFSSSELDEIIQSFEGGGYITSSAVGNQIIYTMPQSRAEEIKNYFKGK